ncbi:uncharacterized protein LOC135848783 [Planococcus citri]|uniref:uncharacterized protein LOC135848783 n=1 Tax=Planococcus citri TaxID=170843 RepID=UPI0031F8EC00
MCCPSRYLAIFISLAIFKEVQNACVDPGINADAKAIVDSKFDPKTIASILPYRTQEQSIAINTAIAGMNAGKALSDTNHIPVENTKPYDDLIFALVNDSMTIFSKYLGHYLHFKDETYIIMIFIQIDDRVKFKQTYDGQHGRCFDDARKDQRHPFSNALRVWALGNRVDVSIYKDKDDSCDQGNWLTGEKETWNKKSRTGLEGMLMKHTIEYARRGLECYGKSYVPTPHILDDIKAIITNHDLVDLFTSLVRYIQDDSDYLAGILHDHCDDKDNFTLWIVVLSTRRTPQAMKCLDKAFQAAYNGVKLKDFILKCNTQDTVFRDMLAALVDLSYKPYKITPKQSQPPPESINED